MFMMKESKGKKEKILRRPETKRTLPAERFLSLGFAGVILAGAFLLCLPVSSADHKATNFIDALFTATTSVCVTGLVTVPTAEHWSLFGKVIILLLIQFGGLGIMACMMMVYLIFHRRVSLYNRKLIQDTYNLPALGGAVGIVRRILLGTFFVEGVGAFFYSLYFIPEYGVLKGIWYSVFHAVSAFCNAGIDIVGTSSFAPFLTNPLINLTTMGLIIVSGLGFPVWWETISYIRTSVRKKKHPEIIRKRFSLHARIVLTVTVFLVLGGALMILILDWNHATSLGPLDAPHKVMAAFFQSVTTRTAGFETIPQKGFSDASAMVSMILMFIGGSPMGTAGGVKTTTVAVILLMIWAYIQGREDTEACGRKLSLGNLRVAVVVFFYGLGIVILATMGLTVITGADSLDCMYEIISAMGTVGLTRSLTPSLPAAGKILVILIMFMGRIGPVTLAVALGRRYSKRKTHRTLPEQRVLIG